MRRIAVLEHRKFLLTTISFSANVQTPSLCDEVISTSFSNAIFGRLSNAIRIENFLFKNLFKLASQRLSTLAELYFLYLNFFLDFFWTWQTIVFF